MKIDFDIDALEDIARYKGMDVEHYTHEKTEKNQTLYIFRNKETDELTYVWFPISETDQEQYIPELYDAAYELDRFIYDCTVQTLSNDNDDDVSVGWWYDEPFQG